jgi:CBS-domain-containing membrane protein
MRTPLFLYLARTLAVALATLLIFLCRGAKPSSAPRFLDAPIAAPAFAEPGASPLIFVPLLAQAVTLTPVATSETSTTGWIVLEVRPYPMTVLTTPTSQHPQPKR